MAFSIVLHSHVPRDELCGIVVGHCEFSEIPCPDISLLGAPKTISDGFFSFPLVWYFMNDVYPPLNNGRRPFDPPSWWVWMWEGRPEADTYEDESGAQAIDHDIAAAAAPEVR